MKELYPVRLNGVGLNAIDTRFHVANVEEEAPKIKVTTQSRAKYDGLRMMRRERETRRIIVHVVLWERDKMKRLEMYDKLVEWAENGGMLTLGYRNGQQIRVECTELPDISGRDWKEEVDVVFTAYDPYWRGLDPMATSVSTAAGQTATAYLRPRGTARHTFLEFEITNTDTAAMSSLSVSVNGGSFILRGLTLAYGKTLIASYDNHGFLALKVDGTSVMDKRTADSADDLVIRQRESNEITIVTDQAARARLLAWEQWL